MSAAEKLQALEPVHLTIKAGVEDPYAVGAITLYNVPLPQIVAVVEAAELVRLTAPLPGMGQPGYAAWKSCERALAALDEKLA